MKSSFRGAYAKRLRSIADRMSADLPDTDIPPLLMLNADLWAALDSDVRAGLFSSPEILAETLLTRARTVAEQTRLMTRGRGDCQRLILLNRQTASLLDGHDQRQGEEADCPKVM
ncbi:hypothetical protein [Novispirillum itersonii]|uniref:hypothetical protein n=1 Tax=Novispirillum itersonii TaxID=189 RepID=UPI00036F4270|nr:hypothetical protein [Novispirillum itersonii]